MPGFDGVQAITLRDDHRALRAFLKLTSEGMVGDLHVATVGVWAGHPSGPFALTETDIDHAIERFESQHNPMMVDYDHKSLNSSGSPLDGYAAGWIQSLDKRMGGSGAELWAKVEWTPAAAAAIKNGEYKYCSPVLDWGGVDRKTGKEVEGLELFNCAITNQPFLDGNHPIQLTRVKAGQYEDNLRGKPSLGEEKEAPPPPPPPPPNAKSDDEDEQAKDGEPPKDGPPPPEPPPPPVEPEKNVEDAQLTTAIDALMRVLQVDRAAVVAALGEYADEIGSMLSNRLEFDGTPAEGRAMSEKQPDGNAPPAAGGAPPAADDAKRIEAIERKQSENQLTALKAQLDDLQAKEKARTEGEVTSRRKGVELHVKHLMDNGYVRDVDKDDALYMFEHHPERAQRIWANQVVPIGTTQAGPNAAAPAAPSSIKPVEIDKATESDLLPHERPVFESQLRAGKNRAVALKVVLSNRDEIARNAHKLGLTG